MKIHAIAASRWTPEFFDAWSEVQRADIAFDSPYFRPEFTQAVASVRGDVEIGVLEEGGEAVGFFPFQRGRRNVAAPVGGILSDFQGVIVRPGASWSDRELLEGCGLMAWHFDHLLVSQKPFQKHHWKTMPSPYMDLSQGWEGYCAGQRELHPYSFKQWGRKIRRAEREAGPVRLEVDSNDSVVFQTLMRWKIEQYQKTGVPNVLAVEWTRNLLEQIFTTRNEAFGGMMSALYLRDELAAVLFSMRTRDVVHSWFSAYNPELAAFSPGILLFLEIAKAYPALGVQRIDLGKGPERYKEQLASGTILLAEGAIDRRPVARIVRRNWMRAYEWARTSPLRRPLLTPSRFVKRIIQSRRLEQ